MTSKRSNKQSRIPSRCPECQGVVELAHFSYTAKVKHSGRLHEVQVERLHAPKCSDCGEIFFTTDVEAQIISELRRELGLLQPEDILRGITATEIAQQRSLAELTGIAAETISRFVNGSVIQSRALDTLLRVVLEFRSVRDALRTGRETLGSQVSEDPPDTSPLESSRPALRFIPAEQKIQVERITQSIRTRGIVAAIV